MILITTSNGVFRLKREDPEATLVLPRDKGFFFLRKGSGGFFGIARHPDGRSVLAASRERLGTPKKDKPWTDTRLYRIWPGTERKPEILTDLPDVHDVHQIAVWQNLVLLTDTGMNRLRVLDLDTLESWNLPVGPHREDINHLNAVLALEDRVMLGLNNRGSKPAEILTVGPEMLQRENSGRDLLTTGELQVLGQQLHTHDIEPLGADFLYCASHDGRVHRLSDGRTILQPGGWVRGLAGEGDNIWVGASHLAERSQRHREDVDGQIHLFEARTGQLLQSWQLFHAGQVNDILVV